MLNILHVWCRKWRMKINEAKSMVMHIRTRSAKRSCLNFQCGQAVLKYSDKYKYLGIRFNEHFETSEMAKYVAQAANRSLGLLI